MVKDIQDAASVRLMAQHALKNLRLPFAFID